MRHDSVIPSNDRVCDLVYSKDISSEEGNDLIRVLDYWRHPWRRYFNWVWIILRVLTYPF